MANEIIQVGNKIEMRPVQKWNSEDNGLIQPYISQFIEWTDYNAALIAIPWYQGQLVPLHPDDEYSLCFYAKGGLYQCKAVVLRRTKKESNIAMAEVKFTSDLEKIQRRQFYRMDCMAPLKYAALTMPQLDMYVELKYCMYQDRKQELEKLLAQENLEFKMGTVLDISGGGMRFNSPEQNVVNSVLVLMPQMPYDDQQRLSLLFGRVIASNRLTKKEQVVFDNRIEFVRIRPAEQERIITYIFKEEREKRKRELDMK